MPKKKTSKRTSEELDIKFTKTDDGSKITITIQSDTRITDTEFRYSLFKLMEHLGVNEDGC